MLHIMNFKSSCSLPILSSTGGLAPCHSFKSSSSLPNLFATGGPASFLSFKSSFSSPILFATGGPAPFHRVERTEQDINKHKVFMVAKGYRGTGKNCTRIAKQRVRKALQYSYRDRNNRKRDMRTLWIQRINAGAHLHGINYEDFMHGLMKQNIQLNRKVLSELSVLDPYSFKALVDISQNAFP